MPSADPRRYAEAVDAAVPALRFLVEDRPPFRCLYVSGSGGRLGLRHTKLEGRPITELVQPQDTAALAALLQEDRDPRRSLLLQLETREHRPEWFELQVVDAHPEDGPWLIVSVRDSQSFMGDSAAMALQAQTDALTGAVNRTVFLDRLRHALRRLERHPATVGVLVFDVDHFKNVNDTWGHRVGDQVLTELARRVSLLLRPSDTLARLGGDEFVVLAEDLDEDLAAGRGAVALAERIVSAGRARYDVTGGDLSCTLSIGIAVTSDSTRHPDSLVHDADIAMYRAKARGRDRAELYDERLRIWAMHRTRTEQMLRDALTHQRLSLEYQPVVHLPSETLAGVEALVRLRTPSGRDVMASSFLDIASDSGLLRSIDDWVLTTAAAAPRFSVPVTLNIGARDIEDPQFEQRVLRAFGEANVPAAGFQLELTERSLLAASDRALTAVQSLRQHGLRIGLDAFGTGATALSSLWDFPLDYVKVARAVIEQIGSVRAADGLLEAIVRMAHGLGLHVVATGVESERQRDLVTTVGCDQAQGFLWSASTDPDGIHQFAGQHPPPGGDRG